MADCEKNVFDVAPVTPSIASPSDYVLVHLADGTSFLRQWSNFLNTAPDDLEINVVESDGDIEAGTLNNGDSEVVIESHIGWRSRVFRNGLPQSRDITKATYYAFDNSTGTYVFTPALSTEEFLQFQVY